MKPSVLSTSQTRSRCLEPGMETFDLVRICALRMRVIMSPIGSLTAIAIPLPARLHKAGNQALGAEVAESDAAETMLVVIGARTAGQLATIADARGRGIARQLGKLEGGGKTLLHRQSRVVSDCLERLAAVGELLRHPAPPVVLLDRTLLSHTFAPYDSAFEGKPLTAGTGS